MVPCCDVLCTVCTWTLDVCPISINRLDSGNLYLELQVSREGYRCCAYQHSHLIFFCFVLRYQPWAPRVVLGDPPPRISFTRRLFESAETPHCKPSGKNAAMTQKYYAIANPLMHGNFSSPFPPASDTLWHLQFLVLSLRSLCRRSGAQWGERSLVYPAC